MSGVAVTKIEGVKVVEVGEVIDGNLK